MPNQKLSSHVAVVTGGASGIGAEICHQLLMKDYRVYSLDLDSKISNLPTSEVVHLDCDITNESELESCFQEIASHGEIDSLFINAGVVPSWSGVSEFSREAWYEIMEINVIGAALTLKHGTRKLTRPGGKVVFTASLNSWKGDPNIASYVASKHAVLGLVKSAAMELGPLGIRVNAVAPGPIATTALQNRILTRSKGDEELAKAVFEQLSSTTALRRIARSEEVANVAIFLASNESSGVTGQMINVDCGVL
jgi:NAD(P)-dependent dehydrogenase (short-subunit alcohol dehydrogenase family)